MKHYIMNKQKETIMKTIFNRMAMFCLLCGVLGVFVACDGCPEAPYEMSTTMIYAPNTTIAVEGIWVNYADGKPYTDTFYDTLNIEKYFDKTYTYCVSRNDKKRMRLLQSVPDHQYLKITRLKGESPIYFSADRWVKVNGQEVFFDSDNIEEQCGYSMEEILQALVKIGRAVVWDDNEQHKVSRISEDWPSCHQEVCITLQ